MQEKEEAALAAGAGDLYRGPLEDFIAKRDALAAGLRDSGEAEASKAVKALKKPTRAAWLVNQLADRRPKQVARLREIGDELRARQKELLEGAGDPAAVRKAAQREQRAIDDLAAAAQKIGAEHEVGPQILDRAVETLQAAAVDPELAETVSRGTLSREQRRSSVGLGAIPEAPPGKRPQKQRRRKPRSTAAEERALKRARERLDKAREQLVEREDELRDAEAALALARKGSR